jgi:hypothetical protein
MSFFSSGRWSSPFDNFELYLFFFLVQLDIAFALFSVSCLPPMLQPLRNLTFATKSGNVLALLSLLVPKFRKITRLVSRKNSLLPIMNHAQPKESLPLLKRKLIAYRILPSLPYSTVISLNAQSTICPLKS